MATLKEGKHKRKTTIEPNMGVSWQERKYLVDKEEETLKQDIEDLKIWTNMIDEMDNQQLKEYIEKRPVELKMVKIQKSNHRPKVEKLGKCRSSISNNGIMASVWKFHKDDQDD